MICIIVNNFKVMEYIYEWKLICWCLSLNIWTFEGEEGNEGRWPLRRQEGYQHSRPRHCQAILQGKKQHVVWSKTKKITPARTEATCWNLASEMDEWPKTATPNTSVNLRHCWTDIYCSFIFDFCGIFTKYPMWPITNFILYYIYRVFFFNWCSPISVPKRKLPASQSEVLFL